MWTIPQITAYIRRRSPAIIEFINDCLAAYGVIILTVLFGIFLLSLFYSVVAPPIHPLIGLSR
jgi:hypothetical protein